MVKISRSFVRYKVKKTCAFIPSYPKLSQTGAPGDADTDKVHSMSWNITKEKEFLNDLQRSSQPLRVMVVGRFTDKQFPLEYAHGLVIEDLQSDDGVPLTCSH